MSATIQETPVQESSLSDATGTMQLVSLRLAEEEYGLEILKVREIIGLSDITQVPQTPTCVKGVIDLRGKVIPVIDLRLEFGLKQAEYNDHTCIIVVEVGTLMGIIVDTVQEVHDIPAASIDPPPELGASIDTTFILGMGKVKDGVTILLDIERVLKSQELVECQTA